MTKYLNKVVVGWNKVYLQSVSKDEFVKAHEHLKDNVDLGKVWQDAQPKTDSKK